MGNIVKKDRKTVYPIVFESNYGQMKTINCYLYENGDKLTLIDAGIDLPVFHKFFDAKLAEYGFALDDIDQIVLTHHHNDHTGMINRIVANRPIPVYAHYLAVERLHLTEEYQLQKRNFFLKLYKEYDGSELAKPRLKKMAETLEKMDKLKINAEITPLYEGDTIADLQVKEVPGHSPDSILLYDAEMKWLFVGDLVLYTGTTNALVDHDEQGQLLPTVAQYKHSLEIALTYDAEMAFAGHQQPYANLTEIVSKNLDRIQFKVERIHQQIQAGNETALQLANAIYGQERLKKEFPLIISEIIGYTLYAEQLGIINREVRNGINYFKIV